MRWYVLGGAQERGEGASSRRAHAKDRPRGSTEATCPGPVTCFALHVVEADRPRRGNTCCSSSEERRSAETGFKQRPAQSEAKGKAPGSCLRGPGPPGHARRAPARDEEAAAPGSGTPLYPRRRVEGLGEWEEGRRGAAPQRTPALPRALVLRVGGVLGRSPADTSGHPRARACQPYTPPGQPSPYCITR